ncbi:MAG: hypothetical protein RLZ98_1002 [Pseudomonadota bacterium]|jgi:signal transduction histidine kinase
MKLNSLAFRLFATAAVWTLIVLPLAGLIIHSLYRDEVQSSFDDRMKTLLTVIVADSVDNVDGIPTLPKNIGEPLFEISQSGWYWQIKPIPPTKGPRFVSASLATGTLPSPLLEDVDADPQGLRWLNVEGPNEQELRIAETVHTIGSGAAARNFSFTVAAPLDWLEARVSLFTTRLATALSLAGLGLVAVTLFQVHFGLLPLRAIEKGLADIRSGDAEKLEGELPAEIVPLQVELNALIESNQSIIERARTQVGNLAHALKTPLSVITNEAAEKESQFAKKVAEQARIMGDQVSLYLDRARMVARTGTVGRVTQIMPVTMSLQRALERIYRDRGIVIRVSCPENAKFQGEQHDLEEMLGNLMDNACKWANGTVHVAVEPTATTARTGRRRLVITVEDDGPGLSDSQRARLGKRGLRLDETKPGSGLGLSIVTDLATSYEGGFRLEASGHGGLKAILELPAA